MRGGDGDGGGGGDGVNAEYVKSINMFGESINNTSVEHNSISLLRDMSMVGDDSRVMENHKKTDLSFSVLGGEGGKPVNGRDGSEYGGLKKVPKLFLEELSEKSEIQFGQVNNNEGGTSGRSGNYYDDINKIDLDSRNSIDLETEPRMNTMGESQEVAIDWKRRVEEDAPPNTTDRIGQAVAANEKKAKMFVGSKKNRGSITDFNEKKNVVEDCPFEGLVPNRRSSLPNGQIN